MLRSKWKKYELGEVVRFMSGGTPSTTTTEYWNGDIPWVSAKDLKQHFVSNSIISLTQAGAQTLNLVPENTVLMLVRGMTLLKDVPIAITTRPMTFNQDVKGLVPNKEIEPVYLSYLLAGKKHTLMKLVDRANHGTGRLDSDLIKSLPLDIPPLEEQARITAHIRSCDRVIDAMAGFLHFKTKRRMALAQRLLTGKQRFPEFKNLEWKKLKANKLFKNVSQKKNGDATLLAVMQDIGVVPRDMLDRKVAMPEGSTEGYKLIEPGNYVISLRSFQGGLEYSRYRGLVSPAYTVLKPTNEIDDDFYRHYFKSYDFIGHLAVAVIGIRDGKQISYEDFSFLDLPYPSLKEQKMIAAALNAADLEVEVLAKKLDALKEQKKGLMQQLLTGKKRLKIDKQEAA